MDEFSKIWISTNDVLFYYHNFGFFKENFNHSDLVNENFIITGYSKNPEGK